MLLAASQPLRHGLEHGPQKAKGGPRRIQVVEPASQSGGVGDAIGIFQRRRSMLASSTADFTSILSMSRDARAGVLAALREIYDGRWDEAHNPVQWGVSRHLAAPLAMRRSTTGGIAALMTRGHGLMPGPAWR